MADATQVGDIMRSAPELRNPWVSFFVLRVDNVLVDKKSELVIV